MGEGLPIESEPTQIDDTTENLEPQEALSEQIDWKKVTEPIPYEQRSTLEKVFGERPEGFSPPQEGTFEYEKAQRNFELQRGHAEAALADLDPSLLDQNDPEVKESLKDLFEATKNKDLWGMVSLATAGTAAAVVMIAILDRYGLNGEALLTGLQAAVPYAGIVGLACGGAARLAGQVKEFFAVHKLEGLISDKNQAHG